jgi:hypothetical protein
VFVGGFAQPWASGGGAPGQVTYNTPVVVTLSVIGADLFVYLNSVLVAQTIGLAGNAAQKHAGFMVYLVGSGTDGYTIDNFSVSGVVATIGSSSRILACSGGALASGIAAGSWAAVGSGMNTTGVVHGQAAYGKIYLVDGVAAHYKVYNPTTQSTTTWTPTAPGVLPKGAIDLTLGATIIKLYRGRIVLSGVQDDPQNWFMSRAGDPLDWDYGGTVTALMPVAGNNSVAGLVGDRITCLAPVGDDLMVMGGDHTLWVMRGDPADGGRVDNLSQQVGIIGPDAYAIDPTGTMYFFGNGILWRLTFGTNGGLTALSQGRLDKTFGAIDFSLNTMRLLWDDILHGLHIFVTPTISGTTTHYWWDARTDSFWRDQRPDSHGPTAVLLFDADAPNDRAILLGGQDGYVRAISATAKTDDGTTILSRVKFGPMTPGGIHQNMRVNRVTTILESSSDPVALRVFAAQSPEEVVAQTTPAWSYLVTPISRYSMPRIGGNSLLFELKNDSFSAVWATGTVYAVGAQVVASDGLPYVALTAHTSTTGGAHPTPPGNTTDWVVSVFRTWALESVSAVMDVTGRTRHGRL